MSHPFTISPVVWILFSLHFILPVSPLLSQFSPADLELITESTDHRHTSILKLSLVDKSKSKKGGTPKLIKGLIVNYDRSWANKIVQAYSEYTGKPLALLQFIKGGAKDKNIKELVVLQIGKAGRVTEFTPPTATWLKSRVGPVDKSVFSTMILELIEKADPKDKIQIAKKLNDYPSVQAAVFESLFKPLVTVDEVLNFLETKKLWVEPEAVKAAGRVSIDYIRNLEEARIYFKEFGETGDLSAALFKLSEKIGCEDVLELVASEPLFTRLSNSVTRDIRLECLSSVGDFQSFIKDYPESDTIILKRAATLVAKKSRVDDCAVMELLNQKVFLESVERPFVPYLIECMDEVEEAIKIAERYSNPKIIRTLLARAVKKFGYEGLKKLDNSNAFTEFQQQIKETRRKYIRSLTDIDDYYKAYGASDDVDRRVLLSGVRVAQEENNKTALINNLKRYIKSGGSVQDIVYYLPSKVVFDLIESDDTLRDDLSSLAVRAAVTDLPSMKQYLKLFDKGVADILAELDGRFSAEVGKFLYEEQGGDVDGLIEKSFPSSIESADDVDWFLEKFPASPFKESVFMRGIALTRGSNQDKYFEYIHGIALLKRQAGKPLDKATFLALIPGLDDKIAFLKQFRDY